MPVRRVHSAAMPELAEVEHGRRIAHEVAVGRTITAAWVDDDDIVVDGVTPDAVVAALAGATVAGTGRHGKHLWLVLQDRPTVLLHFGMTGGFRTRGDAPLQLEGSPSEVDTSWPPRFTKLLLRFDDGAELAMTNARRLGRIRLRDDVRAEAPIADLGFDPYLTLPTLPKLKRLLARRKRAKLKGLLLDQGFAAGVGNWIADEVLYQAALDPRRAVGSLSDDELNRLRLKLRHVVKTAVRVDARKDAFPRGWLFHRRWGRQEDIKTVDGEPIEHITVAGRTTAWVPSIQR